jgi:hypothetical protein
VNEDLTAAVTPTSDASTRSLLLGTIGWVWVGLPCCYGLVQLIVKIPALFWN